MRALKNISISIFIILIIMSVGCSGDSSRITQPSPQNTPETPLVSSLPLAISDIDQSGNPIAGQGFLGLFSLILDKTSLTGELISLRKTSLTDVLEAVDITNFMQLAPCADCVKLMSVELNSDGNLVVKIGIKHPFPAGDPLKPISGRNRADLHVFNVEGLIISDGPGTTSFPGLGKTIGSVGLVNADGYSGYLDVALDEIFPTEADIHPYILHFDDYTAGSFDPANPMGFLSVTKPPPSGNLVMAMGCDYNVQDYVFDIEGKIDFIYAVGCTYAVAAQSKAMRFTPEYRIPQHNKKAASEVTVEVTNNELSDGDETSSATLDVRVVDINHGVVVGEALNEMLADSSVNDVLVEIPGVITSPVSFGNTPISGTGHDPSDPLVFEGTIYNTAKAPEGTYMGLVKVLDTYTPGLNAAPILEGKDGIKRVDPLINPLEGLFEITEFATYTTFAISVEKIYTLPVAVLVSTPAPPDASTCQFIRFDGSGSYDTGGYNIVSYEWDWDYTGNPAEFVADKITSSGFEKHQYYTEDIHTTGLRVVNDAPSPQTSEPVSLTHNVSRPLASDYLTREVNRVSLNDGSSNDIWMPGSNAIVVDDNNAVHVFSKVNGASIVHYKYDAGVVTSETLGSMTNYAHQSAVIDSQGVIHVMWYGGLIDTNHLLYYSNNSSGNFSAPADVGDCLEHYPYSYSLGINGQDELMFVWQELFSPLGGDYMGYIYKFGSDWSTAAILTDTLCSTEQPYSRLAVMVSVNGTPGENGKDFHCIFTQQFTDGYMNPGVSYSKFDRATLTWSTPEYAAPDLPHYQDWSDSTVTEDGDVFVASSYAWSNAFALRKDGITGLWTSWWVAQTGNIEYTSSIGANRDCTICFVWWDTPSWNDPIMLKYKVFYETSSQTDVNAITPLRVDESTTNEHYFADIFTKECDFYVAFMDDRDDPSAYLRELYVARIGQ